MIDALRIIEELARDGQLVVWVEETRTLHEASSATLNGSTIQLNCRMDVEAKVERLVDLLHSAWEMLPEGEIRALVAELYLAQQPTYSCSRCANTAGECRCSDEVQS